MRLTSVRLGHACNSSSSHSLLLPAPGQAVFTQLYDDNFQFGWENFTLADASSKAQYLGQLLHRTLQGGTIVGDNSEQQEIVEMILNSLGLPWSPMGYVDHQSVPNFTPDLTDPITLAFLTDLRNFVVDSDVVVLGGNDNDNGHPLANATEREGNGQLFVLEEVLDGGSVLHRDPSGYWLVYNPRTGAKVRFFLDDGLSEPERAMVPELVDLKITDYCPIGCDYCYQDSTTDGQHADLNWLWKLIKSLRRAGALEIALGGGEAVLHPEFDNIVTMIHREGITPNLTTRMWTRINRQTLNKLGAVAVSVEPGVPGFRAIRRAHEALGDKLVVQVVDRLAPPEEYAALQRLCLEQGIPFTLLGYKRVGRAQPPQFSSALLGLRIWELRVDTALVREQSEYLEQVADAISYDGAEGRFSAYIDGVRRTMQASSYDGDNPFPLSDHVTGSNIVRAFANLEVQI